MCMAERLPQARASIKYLVRDVLLSANRIVRYRRGGDTISKQSGDIALGVDKKSAGDQGMMFGYATKKPDAAATLRAGDEAIDSLQTRRHSACCLMPAQVTTITVAAASTPS